MWTWEREKSVSQFKSYLGPNTEIKKMTICPFDNTATIHICVTGNKVFQILKYEDQIRVDSRQRPDHVN